MQTSSTGQDNKVVNEHRSKVFALSFLTRRQDPARRLWGGGRVRANIKGHTQTATTAPRTFARPFHVSQLVVKVLCFRVVILHHADDVVKQGLTLVGRFRIDYLRKVKGQTSNRMRQLPEYVLQNEGGKKIFNCWKTLFSQLRHILHYHHCYNFDLFHLFLIDCK